MAKIGNIDLGDFPLLLAPMEDVSDPPFRALCKSTELTLCTQSLSLSEGLIRDAAKGMQKLDIYEYERPIGIQIFGSDLEPMIQSAEIVEATNPDILDINFGCPVKKVACKGAGAGILQDIPKMVRLTEAVVKATKLPVTVKTRLGWSDDTKYIVEVAERLQDVGIQAISIHGRTRQQMYKGEADWTLIREVKENPRIHIPVFGNGDIDTPQKALEYKNKYGVDGVMVGRASIGYPWIFREIKHFLATGEMLPPPQLGERVDAAIEHLKMGLDWKGQRLGVVEMRRHYSNYFRGMHGFKEHRIKLVTEENPERIFELLEEIREMYVEHVFD